MLCKSKYIIIRWIIGLCSTRWPQKLDKKAIYRQIHYIQVLFNYVRFSLDLKGDNVHFYGMCVTILR